MSTRLKGLIGASLDLGDGVETALTEIRDGMFLSSAIGVQLDTLGKQYGVQRTGRSDTDYRQAIQVQAAASVNGTPDEIVTFLQLAYGLDAKYTPEYPGAFFIEPPSQLTMAQLQTISPAGIAGFPADYAILENGEYETLENGERILIPNVDGYRPTLQDTLASVDTRQDTLDAIDIVQDTLEG